MKKEEKDSMVLLQEGFLLVISIQSVLKKDGLLLILFLRKKNKDRKIIIYIIEMQWIIWMKKISINKLECILSLPKIILKIFLFLKDMKNIRKRLFLKAMFYLMNYYLLLIIQLGINL